MQKKKRRKRKVMSPLTKIVKFLGEDPSSTPPAEKIPTTGDDDIDATAENQLRFIFWVQNFTKRIVVVVFGIYILIDMITLIAAIYSMIANKDATSVNTLISEMNVTFRDVIGGYLIKAACENVSGGIEKVLVAYLKKKGLSDDKSSSDNSSDDDVSAEDLTEEGNDEIRQQIADELAMPDEEPADADQQ